MFYFPATALPDLSLLLLAALLAAYFALLPKKAAGTWWLVALLAAEAVLYATNVFAAGAYTAWAAHVNAAMLVNPLVVMWAMLGFAYRFLGNPYPRESRGVLTVTGIAAAAQAVGHVVWGFMPPGPALEDLRQALLITAPFLLVLVLWTLVVLLRRAGRRPDDPDGAPRRWRGPVALFRDLRFPATPESRAFRVLLLIELCSVAALVALVLRDAGVIGPFAWRQATLVATLCYFLGLVTAYANFVPVATTFQVKVVGFALMVALGALGLGAVVAFQAPAWEGADDPAPVHFTPVGDGAYRVEVVPPALDRAAGDPIDMQDGMGRPVDLGFAFPFAGESWREVYVDDDGFVSFGSTFQLTGLSAPFGMRTPWIGPLVADLDPHAGRILLERAPGRATITWSGLPVYGRPEPTDRDRLGAATAQLVLEASGAVTFQYGRLPDDLPRLRGLHPGPLSPGNGGVEFEGTAPGGGARILRPETGMVEDRLLPSLQAEHRRGGLLGLLLVLYTLGILIAFPLYLRAGITRPLGRLLGGVRRVNAGDLTAEVPVGVHDEIGQLTADFNTMTASLRRYANEMEGLVAERTAALQQKSRALEEKTTALARSLEDLRTAQDRLIHQEKMASLGALTAGIAHEIKNPLNFVVNFAGLNAELAGELRDALAAGDDALTAETLDALETNARKVQEHGRRADGIVRSMLDHSRGERGDRRSFDVNDLVEEHVGLAYHGARARDRHFHCAVETYLDPAVGEIEGMPQDVGRVLLNLLANAFDAVRARAHPGGDGAAAPYAPRVQVRTARVDGEVRIEVEDNGAGIPPEVRQRIFEPFFTTKPTGQGNTGLGLSMSHEIVVQGHGGRLEVASTPGEGTTFTVVLPG